MEEITKVIRSTCSNPESDEVTIEDMMRAWDNINLQHYRFKRHVIGTLRFVFEFATIRIVFEMIKEYQQNQHKLDEANSKEFGRYRNWLQLQYNLSTRELKKSLQNGTIEIVDTRQYESNLASPVQDLPSFQDLRIALIFPDDPKDLKRKLRKK